MCLDFLHIHGMFYTSMDWRNSWQLHSSTHPFPASARTTHSPAVCDEANQATVTHCHCMVGSWQLQPRSALKPKTPILHTGTASHSQGWLAAGEAQQPPQQQHSTTPVTPVRASCAAMPYVHCSAAGAAGHIQAQSLAPALTPASGLLRVLLWWLPSCLFQVGTGDVRVLKLVCIPCSRHFSFTHAFWPAHLKAGFGHLHCTAQEAHAQPDCLVLVFLHTQHRNKLSRAGNCAHSPAYYCLAADNPTRAAGQCLQFMTFAASLAVMLT